MKHISAVLRTNNSPRRTQACLPSALLFLGGNFLFLSQAWADNGSGATAAGGAAAQAGAALPSSSGSVFTMLFGLIAVLALMAGVAWLFKRFGLTQNFSGNAAAKVIGGVSVGTRERVMVIEVGEQWIVVGVAPGRVNALATMPRQELPSHQQAKPGTPAFASWLKHTMDKRNGSPATEGRTGNDGSTT
ncbi:flagellar biosynthetic protein FliO [Herbaspirillum sp. LeCh32-8]|uniref:flagellar biosynthetic protein FliO n=1 Tax=Herbaspirillum sp. LeCh32-8 TaxID=2821356 RepID=UPI001AE20FCB|nr:flagellar biosynthetic protein FliO [Herbaspirillum sp. LeCh32-8]MBP0596969.1 flagellar biosynthetic protein FliO [Herbaspirillum sp. LeCh32-8]